LSFFISKENINIPNMIYGTAWKKDKTSNLVYEALKEGFRGIDTAGQPKHYNEKGVGEGINKSIKDNIITRNDLYIQTKFTPIDGQDKNNMPYEITDDLKIQIRKSFENSKKNLQVEYIDSYILHSPIFPGKKLIEAWLTMEEFYSLKEVGQLGISNCYDLDVLKYLYKNSDIKPAIVQNRFYAQSGYDKEIRVWCKQKGILYQSFWSLTANPEIVNSSVINQLSKKYNKTKEQIFYKFLNELEIIPLNGTTSNEHMKLDLNIKDFYLEKSEIETISSML